MNYSFRQAELADIDRIWMILRKAIERRKAEGSSQWQDGYPNPEVIKKDIEKGAGYVLVADDEVVAYCAVMINDEPAYADIEGQWLTNEDFVVIHRVAVAARFLGKGIALRLFRFIEEFAVAHQIFSVKVDTNFDNGAMLHIFERLEYVYCGTVNLRGGERKAFEKKLQ